MAYNKKIPCEVWSRVVGYFRPVQQWNIGKKSEWEDKKFLIGFQEEVIKK